jgi:peptide/nickel transport system substrate-binding protein
MKAVAGEIDMQLRHMLWTNYPLFVENAEKGDYRILEWELAEGSNCAIIFNYTHQDPVLRELYANKDFRTALSIAINRDEINEIAYMGFGTPRQSSLSPGSPYFRPEHATNAAEFDPDHANEILDGILPEKDAEGFRMRPDGQRLTIYIEYAPIFGPWRDVLQMVNEQWKAVGIDAPLKEEDRSLLDQRTTAGEQDMRVWTQDYNYTPLLSPHWFCPPISADSSAVWNTWYQTRGESGEEPWPEVKAQVELYWKIMGTPPEQLDPLAQEFFDTASESLWFIGIVGMLPHVGVAKNNFRNVPAKGISDWLQLTPGNGAPEQWFFKQS